MNRVEQLHRLFRLVRLQPTDAVQAYVGIAHEQVRPFHECFLDPAFSEIALSRGDEFLDLFGCPRLADGDELDIVGLARSKLGNRGNSLKYVLPASLSAVGISRLYKAPLQPAS